MLVLTRNENQKIKIGKDITIVLLTCKSGRARIGIEAPREVPVYREEIAEAIERQERLPGPLHFIDRG